MVAENEDLMMISDDGTIIRTAAAGVGVIGRATQGVKVMTVAEGVKVIGLAVAEPEESEEESETPAGEDTSAPAGETADAAAPQESE